MYLTDYMLPTYNSTYIYSCSYLSTNFVHNTRLAQTVYMKILYKVLS